MSEDAGGAGLVDYLRRRQQEEAGSREPDGVPTREEFWNVPLNSWDGPDMGETYRDLALRAGVQPADLAAFHGSVNPCAEVFPRTDHLGRDQNAIRREWNYDYSGLEETMQASLERHVALSDPKPMRRIRANIERVMAGIRVTLEDLWVDFCANISDLTRGRVNLGSQTDKPVPSMTVTIPGPYQQAMAHRTGRRAIDLKYTQPKWRAMVSKVRSWL